MSSIDDELRALGEEPTTEDERELLQGFREAELPDELKLLQAQRFEMTPEQVEQGRAELEERLRQRAAGADRPDESKQRRWWSVSWRWLTPAAALAAAAFVLSRTSHRLEPPPAPQESYLAESADAESEEAEVAEARRGVQTARRFEPAPRDAVAPRPRPKSEANAFPDAEAKFGEGQLLEQARLGTARRLAAAQLSTIESRLSGAGQPEQRLEAATRDYRRQLLAQLAEDYR